MGHVRQSGQYLMRSAAKRTAARLLLLCREICSSRTRTMTSGRISLDPRPLFPSLQASAKVLSGTPVIETCPAWLKRHSSLRHMRGFIEVSI